MSAAPTADTPPVSALGGIQSCRAMNAHASDVPTAPPTMLATCHPGLSASLTGFPACETTRARGSAGAVTALRIRCLIFLDFLVAMGSSCSASDPGAGPQRAHHLRIAKCVRVLDAGDVDRRRQL